MVNLYKSLSSNDVMIGVWVMSFPKRSLGYDSKFWGKWGEIGGIYFVIQLILVILINHIFGLICRSKLHLPCEILSFWANVIHPYDLKY